MRNRAANMEAAPRAEGRVGWFVPRTSEARVNRAAVNALTRDGEGWSFKRSRVSCDQAANAQAMEGLGRYPSGAGVCNVGGAASKAEASPHGRVHDGPWKELPGLRIFNKLADV